MKFSTSEIPNTPGYKRNGTDNGNKKVFIEGKIIDCDREKEKRGNKS